MVEGPRSSCSWTRRDPTDSWGVRRVGRLADGARADLANACTDIDLSIAQVDAEVRAGIRRRDVRTQEELAARQANIDAIDDLPRWSADRLGASAGPFVTTFPRRHARTAGLFTRLERDLRPQPGLPVSGDQGTVSVRRVGRIFLGLLAHQRHEIKARCQVIWNCGQPGPPPRAARFSFEESMRIDPGTLGLLCSKSTS
jgi:hypothetical protein